MNSKYNVKLFKKSDKNREDICNMCNTLFNVNPAGVMIVTFEEFAILEINDTMLDIIGFLREECVGRTLMDFGFFPNRDIREHITKVLIAKKNIHNKEYPFITKSGKLHYGVFSFAFIEFQEQPCILAALSDITCKIDAQYSLKDAAVKLETLFETIPDMLFIISNSGNIIKTNKAVSYRLGYSDEELNKMHVLQLHPKNKKAEIVSVMGQIISGDADRCYIPLVTKNGEEITVETKVVCTSWDSQDVIIGIARDISDRVKMEEKQKELETLLRQTQKMEAIGALAGGIAHDFNNILFPITAYSEMLTEALSGLSSDTIEDSPDNCEVSNNSSTNNSTTILPDYNILKGYVKEIHSAALRAKELVKQILTFSRSEENQENQPVQPKLIVKEAIKLIRKTLPHSIEIKYSINPESKMVMADSTQVYQIIMNLMVNAFHAMELTGGTLFVKLDNIINKGVEHVLIAVSDTGVGMDALTVEKIFNPYFTTKPKGKGTGLGLSVVHGIVQLHKGDISVQSIQGKGTTFNVFLPAIENEYKQNLSFIINNEATKGFERILFVDDEDMIIVPQTKILENYGYKVTPFTSSTHALNAFQNNPYAFDLVITDLSMPQMSGTELSAAILKIRPEIPIILCTGFSYNLTTEQAKEMGIKALLMKPVIKSELVRTIRELLDSCGK